MKELITSFESKEKTSIQFKLFSFAVFLFNGSLYVQTLIASLYCYLLSTIMFNFVQNFYLLFLTHLLFS